MEEQTIDQMEEAVKEANIRTIAILGWIRMLNLAREFKCPQEDVMPAVLCELLRYAKERGW